MIRLVISGENRKREEFKTFFSYGNRSHCWRRLDDAGRRTSSIQAMEFWKNVKKNPKPT